MTVPRLDRVLMADGGSFVTRPIGSAVLLFGGLAGDRHAGPTRPSCARTPWHPRRTPIANTRQLSIVSIEECAAIAQCLGVGDIDPALLGANLVISGLDALSALPSGTRLQFRSGATVFVAEENAPCRQPAAMLASVMNEPRLAKEFVAAALGRRGLVGFVESEGLAEVGETIKVIHPPPHHVRPSTP